MEKNALVAHARDELGISDFTKANPIQAAFTSAITFSIGAAMPLLVLVLSPENIIIATVSTASLLFLSVLGAIGAKVGKANILKATIRVTFWGALAMAVTAIIGKLFGIAV
jgi:VIT1/CCC1 family predicted Fe2+/Mn2+ transporter